MGKSSRATKIRKMLEDGSDKKEVLEQLKKDHPDIKEKNLKMQIYSLSRKK